MTTPEERWRERAATLAEELGAEAVLVAHDLVDESMEPASAGLGVRILGEVEPGYPERAYAAAAELASMVFGLSGAASSSPQWASVLRHLLVAVSRLPVWAGFDRLLGHSTTWVDGVHVGGALLRQGQPDVPALAGLARLDECESVQAFVALELREATGDDARIALEELVTRTAWPSVRSVAAGRPIRERERSAAVHGWLEERAEAPALASRLRGSELAALLRDEDRAPVACEALARWGEAGHEAQVDAAARLLEEVLHGSPSANVRSVAARARARSRLGSLAERVWFLRFDDREHVRAILVNAFAHDEARLREMLDDPSDYVASWAVLNLGFLEAPAAETVSRVLSLALARAGSESGAQAVEVFADPWRARVADADFVRAARANVTDGRWSGQVIAALVSRPTIELSDAVRGWRTVSAYEEELRAEALAACERART